jgi:hypothetical protein
MLQCATRRNVFTYLKKNPFSSTSSRPFLCLNYNHDRVDVRRYLQDMPRPDSVQRQVRPITRCHGPWLHLIQNTFQQTRFSLWLSSPSFRQHSNIEDCFITFHFLFLLLRYCLFFFLFVFMSFSSRFSFCFLFCFLRSAFFPVVLFVNY